MALAGPNVCFVHLTTNPSPAQLQFAKPNPDQKTTSTNAISQAINNLQATVGKEDLVRVGVLFASSVLNLAELLALRPDLTPLKKLLYFHENQLVYPVRRHQDRDFQYGYNQVLSCLVADVVLFNSQYNQDSFLSSIQTHFNIMPDCRPKGLDEGISPKCHVLYFPISFPVRWRDCHDKGIKTSDNTASQAFDLAIQLSETLTNEDTAHNFFLDAEKGKEQNAQATATTSLHSVQSKHSCCEILTEASSEDDKEKILCEKSPQGLVPPGEMRRNYNSEKCSPVCEESQIPPSSNSGPCMPNESEMSLDCRAGWNDRSKDEPLHIVWPHRWEHDKNPELFFQTLFELKAEGSSFTVSVLGQEYTDVPEIFAEAAERLKEHIRQWGHLAAKEDYYRLLHQADVVVSTADHEFYGVSMLEAVYCGCYPLCPNRLVYPEIFPKECLYNTPQQLRKRLRDFCRRPQLARRHSINLDIHQYSWAGLAEEYKRLLQD